MCIKHVLKTGPSGVYLRSSYRPEAVCPRAKLENIGQNLGSESEPPAKKTTTQGHLVNHLQFINGEAEAHGARLEAGLLKAPASTLHLT